jgi:hypothetical protein
MDIINENITYFEDEQLAQDATKKTPRISTSKKKVFRQGPSSDIASTLKEGSTSRNLNFASTDLNLQFSQTTPIKKISEVKEEIKSDVIVRKLLELKERSQLDGLLERYNLKMCFDSQTNDLETGTKNKKIEDSIQLPAKRIDCPICFESENK